MAKKQKETLPENLECFICGKKLKPTNWWKTDGKYFCTEKHINEYENKEYGN